jgi:hypothetical protein
MTMTQRCFLASGIDPWIGLRIELGMGTFIDFSASPNAS